MRNGLLILEQVYIVTCLYVEHTERKDFSHRPSTNMPELHLVLSCLFFLCDLVWHYQLFIFKILLFFLKKSN